MRKFIIKNKQKSPSQNMRSFIMATAAVLMMTLSPQSASASIFVIHLGPPSMGGGGPNPVSIPPQITDTEFVYVTNKGAEYSLGLIPGFLYGIRNQIKYGSYVSFGGGFLFNPGIAGPGLYSAFGYNTTCKTFCFNIEYKHSIGMSGGKIFTPYAVRAGLSIFF